MNPIFRLPLVPIFIVYTLGISFGYLEIPLFSHGWVLLLLGLGFWLLFLFLKRIRTGSWIAIFTFFFLGIYSIQLYLNPPKVPSHVSSFIGIDGISLEGIIDRPPESLQGKTRIFLCSKRVILSNHSIPVNGWVLIYLNDPNPSLHIGDRIRCVCRLARPHGFHNLGGFSYERHLAFEQVYSIGFLSIEKGWVKLGEGYKNPFLLQVEDWRDHIRTFLESEAPPLSAGIFKALVLGEQGDIPEEVKEQFIITGIAHLLAISGDHLGIIALLSFSLILWILKRSTSLLLSIDVKKWAAGLTLPCLFLYTFVAGGGISVIRATIMVILFFLSILFSQGRNLLYTLILAAFLILLFSPPSLFGVSFQLSFVAVFCILVGVPRLLNFLRQKETFSFPKISWREKIIRYFVISFLVTGVAILGTAPFVVLHFNRISLIGFITNLFIIPWVGFIIVPIALVASLLSFFFYPLAALLIHLNHGITLILLQVIRYLSSIPYASLFVPTPTVFEMILFYLIGFLFFCLQREKRVRYLFIGLCMVLLFDFFFWNWKDSFQRDLRITFIDVGHGDSILVEFPKGKKMLIDGGGLYDDPFDVGKNVIAPFLWRKKIRRIDILVLTHPDPDHFKGLPFIASHFSIGQFWDNGFQVPSMNYHRLKKILEEKKIEVASLNEETPPKIINGVELSFLNPPNPDRMKRGDRNFCDLNNSSLVMKLRFKRVSILLTGDIQEEAENRMLRKGNSLLANILKVPHHGSSSSSSLPFLKGVHPHFAVLSVGERNIGNLPHPEILKRYQQLGIKVFRTDKHGSITLITNGEAITVKTFLNP